MHKPRRLRRSSARLRLVPADAPIRRQLSTSSNEPTEPTLCCSRTASITCGISIKASRRSKNACTATSFAALSTAGAVPPRAAHGRGKRQTRKSFDIRRFEIESPGAHDVKRFYT